MLSVEQPDPRTTATTEQPLASYCIDQPLTAEEQQLLEALRTSEVAEGNLQTTEGEGDPVQLLGLYLLPSAVP